MRQIFSTPLTDTGYIPPIIQDYLNDHERLKPFAHSRSGFENPLSHERFLKPFEAERRELLHRVAMRQVKNLQLDFDHHKMLQNVDNLLNPNCFTVTTGQQIHPFGGPLLVFHKITDAINLAATWSKSFPEKQFVPVLWLATDDHDFEEVANFQLLHQAFHWETENAGTWPVGRLSCGNLAEIANKQLNEDLPFDFKQWLNTFKECYTRYATFAEASQAFFVRFFVERGLIVLNPDDAELKAAFLPYVINDIETGINERAVNESIAALEPYYHIQLKPRRINSFFIRDNSRLRIDVKGDSWEFTNGGEQFSTHFLIEQIGKDASSISPNAVMRPMYQEVVLPNLAYIGGPNELAYWLELKPAFDINKIPFPLLGMRNLYGYIPARVIEKIELLRLKTGDFLLPLNDILKKYFESNEIKLYENNDGLMAMIATWNAMEQDGLNIDKSLSKFFEAEKHKAIENWQKAVQKINKSQKIAFENDLKWIESTWLKYFDPKSLPERKLNIFQLFFDIKEFQSVLSNQNEEKFLEKLKIFS